jgi:hypothetical protein
VREAGALIAVTAEIVGSAVTKRVRHAQQRFLLRRRGLRRKRDDAG